MGKNKRRTIEATDYVHNVVIEADSDEEVDTLEWLCEAYKHGIILDFQYQPRSFQLSESISYNTVDGKSRSLFREHIYSPDFIITFNPSKFLDLAKEFKVFAENAKDIKCDVTVDVKGTFAKSDGGRSFTINQKWVYDKYNVYIYKLVPKDFFKKFGVPQNCILTKKTKKPRKAFIGYKTINEVFQLKTTIES